MCILKQYEFCMQCDQPLPKDELERCEEWPQLAARAKQGDAAAKQQLKAHMECKYLSILYSSHLCKKPHRSRCIVHLMKVEKVTSI